MNAKDSYKQAGYTHVLVLTDITGHADLTYFKSKRSADNYNEREFRNCGEVMTLNKYYR